MKKYEVKVTYTVYDYYTVYAENEDEARDMARQEADDDSLNEFQQLDAQTDIEAAEELTERELRDMQVPCIIDYVHMTIDGLTSYTELANIAYGKAGINWLEGQDVSNEPWQERLFEDVSEFRGINANGLCDRYTRMYARRRWQEVKDSQAREWDAAFQKAKADPKTYRVIVETNEREEETGDGDRYFMIDKSDGCGNEYDRWQVIRCDCAASPYDTRTAKAYSVGTEAQPSCEASPANVTRWAERMINAGRVVSIYADCY